MITEFTPWMSLLGGVMIGVSAVILMGFLGRVAGISGIVGGLFQSDVFDVVWRLVFLLGLIAAPLFYGLIVNKQPDFAVTGDVVFLIVGGLLVGFGAIFGSGCTSGHGVCGLSRFSKRSFVAVVVFMVSAAVTVFVMRHLV